MLIAPGLNLGQLLYQMPDDATYHEAYTLRDILFRDYLGQRTEDIPRETWDAIILDCMPVLDCATAESSR
jgi:hypothetical protein